MRNIVCISVYILMFFNVLLAQNPEAREMLIKAENALKSKNMFTYSIDYRIKRFDDNDTTSYPYYHCKILRNEKDTVLGFYGRVAGLHNAGDERIYNGKEFRLIFNKAKQVILDNPAESGKSFAQNNIRLELIPRFLYNSSPYKRFLSNETKITAMHSVKLEGQECWEILLQLKPDEEITSRNITLYIHKKSLYPVKLIQHAKYMNIQDEYIEYTFHDFKAFALDEKDFKLPKSLPKDYKIEKFEKPELAKALLPVGTIIQSLKLREIDGQWIDVVAESERRLILLDFWYLACAPCLRAMPELAKLNEQYREQGFSVVGVNCIDTSTEKITEIRKFKERFGVNYPLASTDASILDFFSIKQYPTYYGIHKGKIVLASQSQDIIQKVIEYLSGLPIKN